MKIYFFEVAYCDLNHRYSVYIIHPHDVIVTPVVTQFIVDKMEPIASAFPQRSYHKPPEYNISDYPD